MGELLKKFIIITNVLFVLSYYMILFFGLCVWFYCLLFLLIGLMRNSIFPLVSLLVLLFYSCSSTVETNENMLCFHVFGVKGPQYPCFRPLSFMCMGSLTERTLQKFPLNFVSTLTDTL